jgi:hypothetical protein
VPGVPVPALGCALGVAEYDIIGRVRYRTRASFPPSKPLAIAPE